MNERKLLLRERVEVRQFEEGLQGSWHTGVVVGVSELSRSVKYNELLCETGESKLIESIPVTEAIEGFHRRRHVQTTYRGRIRPLPPPCQPRDRNPSLSFGICVDALFEDAWWEGVIFDCNIDSDERSVFFPDEGDERKFHVKKLRISRDWDEFLGCWKDRGVWVLVELASKVIDVDLPHFIKMAWTNLRLDYRFCKMVTEWTCIVRSLWDNCFRDVVCKIMDEQIYQGSYHFHVPASVETKNVKQLLRSEQFDFDASSRKPGCKVRNCKGSNCISESAVKRKGSTMDRKEKKQPRMICAQRGKSDNAVIHIPRKRIEVDKTCEILGSSGCRKRKVNSNALSMKKMQARLVHYNLQKPELMLVCQEEKEIKNDSYRHKKRKLSRDLCKRKQKPFKSRSRSQKSPTVVAGRCKSNNRNSDTICIICHCEGELVLCNYCSSSYHLRCVDLLDVPNAQLFCPFCCCGLCGLRDPNCDSQLFTNICGQCGRQYHVDCLSKAGHLSYNQLVKFCSIKCSEIHYRLHQLLGTINPTSVEGITWTLAKRMTNDSGLQAATRTNIRKKLALALDVLLVCFEPIIDPHTNENLVVNVVRSSRSYLKRLDFRGFYVMALQKGDDLACVAAVRIHGHKVAEMPLVATNFQFRGQGMCRLLMQALEKMLIKMGVERLTLPAVSQLRETWETSFGFTEVSPSERRDLLGYPLLGFQGTTMFQKLLYKSADNREPLRSQESVAVPNDKRSFYGLYYHRRSAKKTSQKEMFYRSSRGLRFFENVYRRRRIQANRIGSG